MTKKEIGLYAVVSALGGFVLAVTINYDNVHTIKKQHAYIESLNKVIDSSAEVIVQQDNMIIKQRGLLLERHECQSDRRTKTAEQWQNPLQI